MLSPWNVNPYSHIQWQEFCGNLCCPNLGFFHEISLLFRNFLAKSTLSWRVKPGAPRRMSWNSRGGLGCLGGIPGDMDCGIPHPKNESFQRLSFGSGIPQVSPGLAPWPSSPGKIAGRELSQLPQGILMLLPFRWTKKKKAKIKTLGPSFVMRTAWEYLLLKGVMEQFPFFHCSCFFLLFSL